MKCENASTTGHNIGIPQCFSNEATVSLTVQYHELEKDVLSLCGECAKKVKGDARRHGYKVQAEKL